MLLLRLGHGDWPVGSAASDEISVWGWRMKGCCRNELKIKLLHALIIHKQMEALIRGSNCSCSTTFKI